MKLLSLSLRGAVGIERGLGLEQIDIDFTRFDAGLIALVAPNGSGKSTILENLHPYRCLASRSGALQQHFYLKDSHRDLWFEMAGHVYRCRLLIDGVRGKQESYLYRDGMPVTDGKTPSYDAAVRALFGSEDMFFRSLFRAQNALSIADLTAGKRKEFFVELLGLARIADYHEAAKAKARAAEDALASDRARIDVLRGQADGYEAAEDERDTLTERRVALSASLTDAECNLAKAREALAGADRAIARHEANAPALEEARKRLADVRQRQSAAEARVRSAEDAIGALRLRREADERTADADHTRVVVEETVLRNRAEKIAANRAKIGEGIEKLADLRLALARYEEEQARDRATMNELTAVRTSIAEANAARTLWETKRENAEDALSVAMVHVNSAHARLISGLEDGIAAAQKTASLTGKVPCSGTDLQAGCALLTAALEAADSLPALRAELENTRATLDPYAAEEVVKLTAELAAIEAERPATDSTLEIREAELLASVQEIAYHPEEHEAARQSLRDEEAKNWPGLLAEADAAAETIRRADARIAEAEKQYTDRVKQIRTTHEADTARLTGEKDAAAAEASKLGADATAELGTITALEASAAIHAAAVETRSAAKRQVAEIDLSIGALRTDLDALTRQEAEADARVKTCIAARQEAGALEAAAAPRIREYEEWALLARATGKDGIQALELDAAGPGVADIANQLLADTFGSEFRIAFETTRTSADGKNMLEVFDIRVLTGEGEQLLENLSGGQKVWIEAALSQAIAIYLRRKSGLDLRTSFLDEADGALDTDNAWHYLDMLRASHDLAGTHHTFLITHRRELLSHIPSQILLVPGVGIEVQA